MTFRDYLILIAALFAVVVAGLFVFAGENNESGYINGVKYTVGK